MFIDRRGKFYREKRAFNLTDRYYLKVRSLKLGPTVQDLKTDIYIGCWPATC